MNFVRALTVAFAASTALFAAGAAAAAPPVEAFANLPAMRGASLSPDGTKFAAIQDLKGRPVVVIYAVNAPGTKPVVLPSDDWVIRAIQWVNNDRLVIIAGKGANIGGPGQIWTVTRAIAVSADGTNAVRLLDGVKSLKYNAGAAILDIALNDPANIYMALFNEQRDHSVSLDIFQVDVNTGAATRVEKGGRITGGWVMDGEGHPVARIDMSRSPRMQRLMVRDGSDWREIAAIDGNADSSLGISGLTQDGAGIVGMTHGGKRYSLNRIDMATGKQTVLFDDPRYDVSGTVNDEWTGRVIGAVVTAEGSRLSYFDPARQQLQNALEKAFDGLGVGETTSSADRSKLILAVNGPRFPTVYYYYDATSRKASEIAASYPGLVEDDLGVMKAYNYKARDGLDIPAFITLPPGKTPKNLPAIVMPHGGPDARDSLGFDWWAQFLASRGYVVLQPNYRGSSGYGRAFTEAGLHQWGLKMQDDITDGVRKLIADGIADPKRICIVGASYGGYATLAGATLTPDLYACAASVAGVSDLPDMLKWEKDEHGRESGAVSFWTSRIGDPIKDEARLIATSPARQAANAKAPILLMHGELDTTVPIIQSRLMEDALKKAGKSVTFVELVGDDHYLQLGATRLQMLSELEKFLEANIGH